MGSLTDGLRLLFDADVDALMRDGRLNLDRDSIFATVEQALAARDPAAALSALNTQILATQVMYRLERSESGIVEDREGRPGNDVYLSHLHCLRARVHMMVDDPAAARRDLLAATHLPNEDPGARPLLVDVYQATGRFGHALTLLRRLHQNEPTAQALWVLHLLARARYQGCDDHTIGMGVDFIERANDNELFGPMADEHRSWRGTAPGNDVLEGLHDDLVAQMDAGDCRAAQSTCQRLLAWMPDYAAGWYVLGDLLERESGHHVPTDATGRFAVVVLPDDITRARAAAEAFHLAAYFDPDQAEYWKALSRARLALGELGDAQYAADRAVASAPDDPEGRWLRVLSLWRGETDRVLEALDEALAVVELDPTFTPAVRLLDDIDAKLDEAET
ncbi:hypothetical protein [Mycolicibacterium llatzerense]|uniref:hypothetical protein n=1 Tax=Mycolicibacterium llatzerense TaxID=280871 RepID=UPI0013A6A6F5|nr:hypothetical protein [Mycolicibacterium llatzerense]